MNKKELTDFFTKIMDNKQLCFAIVQAIDTKEVMICVESVSENQLAGALDAILDQPKNTDIDDFLQDYIVNRSFEKLLFKIRIEEEKRKKSSIH